MIRYLNLAVESGGELVLSRSQWPDIWVAVDSSGNRHLFLCYFGDYDVPTGAGTSRIPGTLVLGQIRDDAFVPFDDQFAPCFEADYAVTPAEPILVGE